MVRLILTTKKNMYGEEVSVSEVVIEGGKITLKVLNCHNSAELGLGNCGCNSHPTYIEIPLSVERLEKVLEKYANEQIKVYM